jgi:hypothetical protein
MRRIDEKLSQAEFYNAHVGSYTIHWTQEMTRHSLMQAIAEYVDPRPDWSVGLQISNAIDNQFDAAMMSKLTLFLDDQISRLFRFSTQLEAGIYIDVRLRMEGFEWPGTP